MIHSSRFIVLMTSIILSFLFLFSVLFVDKTIIEHLVVPIFSFLGALTGGGMLTKAVEKSKWSKSNGGT